MADQKSIEAQVEEVMKKVEAEEKSRQAREQIESRKALFQQKKMELAEQVAEFEQENNPMASMMMTMLDVVIQMESTMKMINGVNVAFDCIGQALGCMDELINFNQDIFADSLTHNYGFFARLKRKRERKKAMRNNVNRIKQVCENIQATVDMAQDTGEAMSELSTRVAIMMNKSAARQEKRKKKQLKNAGITTPTVQGSAAARALVDGVKAKKSGSEEAPSSFGGGASSAAPTSSSGDASDIIF